MVNINPIHPPICSASGGCNNVAEFELTDVILADKNKRFEERDLKTVTIAFSCEKHLEEQRNKYA